MPKRDKNFVWRRVDARSLDLKGMKVAIVGGTGGIGRALSRFLCRAARLLWSSARPFAIPTCLGSSSSKRT